MTKIKPIETINRLNRLKLTEQEFRKIHFLEGDDKENETVDSHIEYLTGRAYYQNTDDHHDNYIVALRLEELERLENQGIDRKEAIDICVENHPL
ncbi:hypothetical protein BGP_2792 [Beggiatoa sp. PS]|nr:hypothetical protein BGP_2792 [Beggiatoa sp. PS]